MAFADCRGFCGRTSDYSKGAERLSICDFPTSHQNNIRHSSCECWQSQLSAYPTIIQHTSRVLALVMLAKRTPRRICRTEGIWWQYLLTHLYTAVYAIFRAVLPHLTCVMWFKMPSSQASWTTNIRTKDTFTCGLGNENVQNTVTPLLLELFRSILQPSIRIFFYYTWPG